MRRNMSRGRFLRGAAAGVAAGAALGARRVMAGPPGKDKKELTTLGKVLERGYIKVGVRDGESIGLINWPEGVGVGNPTGFDPDLARALAAAIFGDANPPDHYIEWVMLGGSGPDGRFQALADGTVDVVFRAVSYYADRDIFKETAGFNFAPVMYFDGQDIYLKNGKNLATGSLKIAVKELTSSADNLDAFLEQYNLENGTNHQAIHVTDSNEFLASVYNGNEPSIIVDGISADASILFGLTLSPGLTVPGRALNLGFSKEWLAPMIREDGDEQWRNLVTWVMNLLIQAEEDGIMSGTITPGQYGYLVTLGPEGGPPSLGLVDRPPYVAQNWAYYAIRAVGNYEEVWNNNLLDANSVPWPRDFYNRNYKAHTIEVAGGNINTPPL